MQLVYALAGILQLVLDSWFVEVSMPNILWILFCAGWSVCPFFCALINWTMRCEGAAKTNWYDGGWSPNTTYRATPVGEMKEKESHLVGYSNRIWYFRAFLCVSFDISYLPGMILVTGLPSILCSLWIRFFTPPNLWTAMLMQQGSPLHGRLSDYLVWWVFSASLGYIFVLAL